MRNLFQLNSDGVVEILPQAWLLEDFKAIRDKYKELEIATVELGLVWFAADYRSDFNTILKVTERVEKIKKHVYSNRKLKIDDITYKAIAFYMKDQDTTKIKLIRAVNQGLLRAIATIDTTEMTDLDEIKLFSDIVTKLPGMVDNIDKLEAFVKKEQQLEEGVVGAGQKSIYEDG